MRRYALEVRVVSAQKDEERQNVKPENRIFEGVMVVPAQRKAWRTHMLLFTARMRANKSPHQSKFSVIEHSCGIMLSLFILILNLARAESSVQPVPKIQTLFNCHVYLDLSGQGKHTMENNTFHR